MLLLRVQSPHLLECLQAQLIQFFRQVFDCDVGSALLVELDHERMSSAGSDGFGVLDRLSGKDRFLLFLNVL